MIAEQVRQRLADKLFSKRHLFEAADALSRSGQNWTALTGVVLPHSGHDNENDSGIP